MSVKTRPITDNDLLEALHRVEALGKVILDKLQKNNNDGFAEKEEDFEKYQELLKELKDEDTIKRTLQ